MICKYCISYTVYTLKKKAPPSHKKYVFESENDLLAAADEGMCVLLDKYSNDTTDILFRGITLENAQEVYQAIVTDYLDSNTPVMA